MGKSAVKHGTQKKLGQFRDALKDGAKYDGVILKNTRDEGTVYVPKNPDQAVFRSDLLAK